jgi:N-acetylmuramoyl-L-alanine amidase
LQGTSELPPRAELAALAQAVAVEALKESNAEEQARLYRTAAELRLRSFRSLHVEADAHEALTLLADAARAQKGKETACESERTRAKLLGELHHDAQLSWRELHQAKVRAEPLEQAGESACVRGLVADLELLSAFRLSGEALAEATRLARRNEPSVPGPALASASVALPLPAAPSADLVVSPSALKVSDEPVKVTKIDTYPAEGGGRVVVHLSGPTTFQAGALAKDATTSKDARIYVDIDRAKVKGVKREIEVGGAIKRVRVAPRDKGARIVLDLAESLSRKVYYLPEPFRIVIDATNSAAATASASASPAGLRRVAIDPGHGGHDSGAVGPTGLTEKEVALDVARRAASLLSSELNLETILTRDDDVFIPLEERTARANAFHADLFVSIHCNASENGDARGIEVFVLDHDRDMNRANSRIAALENGVRSKSLDGALDAEMASIASRLRSGEIGASSRRLGLLLEKSALASLRSRYPDVSDHGLKSAGFYVLMGAEMPAVLFETSFISNPEDEARLAKADYRQNLADAVVNAVRAYREGK